MDVFIITGERTSGKSYFIEHTISEKTILTLYKYEHKYLKYCYTGSFVTLKEVYSRIIETPAIIDYDYQYEDRIKLLIELERIIQFQQVNGVEHIKTLFIITQNNSRLHEIEKLFPFAPIITVSRRVTP